MVELHVNHCPVNFTDYVMLMWTRPFPLFRTKSDRSLAGLRMMLTVNHTVLSLAHTLDHRTTLLITRGHLGLKLTSLQSIPSNPPRYANHLPPTCPRNQTALYSWHSSAHHEIRTVHVFIKCWEPQWEGGGGGGGVVGEFCFIFFSYHRRTYRLT